MNLTQPSFREQLPDDAPHILVVDDDYKIRDLLGRYLQENNFRVTTAADVKNARAAMRGLAFDLILLDVMMPGESGLILAEELKTRAKIPVCLLTARAEVDQKIEGLEIGVDDYVTKPFEPRELLLRIKNILRRGSYHSKELSDDVRLGPYVFYIERGELKRNDETIKLTEKERDLLRFFAQRRGLPIYRHELSADETVGSDRTIDVQITRLRRKIECDPANPVYLQTIRGKGYILYTD